MSEQQRLQEDSLRQANWKRWGPYLPDRQWATVREDYSENGDAWNYFGHDDAPSRVYRWGEDGLLGLTDRQCRLCFSVALWNHQDSILKERLFGLTGPEGNHGEDVKEIYYFLDSSPTHSYMRALYKYPQRPFPYEELRRVNGERGRHDLEYELQDTDAFEDDAYFDCFVEYAKAAPDDILIRYTVVNRGKHKRPLTLLPTCWFRNTWGWGRTGEGYTGRPSIAMHSDGGLLLEHEQLGKWRFWVESKAEFLFTENESNLQKLYGAKNKQPYVKDAFHRRVVENDLKACNPEQQGTKAAAWISLEVGPGEEVELHFRLSQLEGAPAQPFGRDFALTMARRLKECDDYFGEHAPHVQGPERQVWRQALAGLLWSKKFYYYAVDQWLEGDPVYPRPPARRLKGRNHRWASNLYNRDVLLMPDGWEYPWYAAWDSAFHVIPLARIDSDLAKQQLLLLLREWYQHPNGQIPAYEWNFDDVNPPVHAWAAWHLYRRDHSRDRAFLARIFQKLLLNFTWWINRTDKEGNNVFSGGFLGLDNVGAFDRSNLPRGSELEQADATAWIAFYCLQMLKMALELAQQDPVYEDIASKFFEHFVAVTHSMNTLGGTGLWDEEDGFYYDFLRRDGAVRPLKIRSMVGLLSLIAVDAMDGEMLKNLPGFRRRVEWFVANRPHLVRHFERKGSSVLLAVATRDRLKRILLRMFDSDEFLSPYGIRSLSKAHADQPFELEIDDQTYTVGYEPGEAVTPLYGGNSNWRGPVWLPVNYLLIGALEQYHKFYGNSLKIPCFDGKPKQITLQEAAQQLRRRLIKLFVPDKHGRRPSHQAFHQHNRPGFDQLILFHEYFHGDTGRGLGAIHQQGWTALVAPLLEQTVTTDEKDDQT